MPSLPWTALAAAALLSFHSTAVDGISVLFPEQTRRAVYDDWGRSPLPTHPPGVSNGIPRELVKKEDMLPYPPPAYLCGLIDNDIYNTLTCNNHLATCAQIGTAVGCCLTDVEDCTAVPTTCLDYTDSCDSECQNSPETLFCFDSYMPYCATWAFESTASLFGCYGTTSHLVAATYLSDYYSEVLGPDYTTYGDVELTDIPSSTASSTRTTGTQDSTSSAAEQTAASADKTKDDGGLSGGAIAGIVVGVVAIAAMFAAFLVWIFVIKRKKNRNEAPPPTQPTQQISPGNGGPPPPMGSQEHYQQLPPPMPYGQNATGFFTPENKTSVTSPAESPQYQPYNQNPPPPPQGSTEVPAYPVYSNGSAPQTPGGYQPTSPSDYGSQHQHNNSMALPHPGMYPTPGAPINEMDGVNRIPSHPGSSAGHPPQQQQQIYQLSANDAGPDPVYELSSTR